MQSAFPGGGEPHIPASNRRRKTRGAPGLSVGLRRCPGYFGGRKGYGGRKKGSAQESVRPPGFIGFPRFVADGLTRFHGPGRESSPMFTDLSARSCIDRRGRRKSPVSVYADDRHGPTQQRTQARAAAQRANSIGWCDGLHGALREGQTVPKIPSNKGLHLPSAPYNPRIPGFKALRDCDALSR
jgi:hypothetical protein